MDGAGKGLRAGRPRPAAAFHPVIQNPSASGGALTANFLPVFALSGGNLANALSQIDGEAVTGGARSAFQLMTEFLTLMLDPSVNGLVAAA